MFIGNPDDAPGHGPGWALVRSILKAVFLILIVGKNSFLGREFLTQSRELSVRAIGHADVIDAQVLRDVSCIVNFSFSPAMYEEDYVQSLDIDSRLARAAKDSGAHYVMISSRKVYQEAIQWGAKEDSSATGSDTYGKNKLRIEANLVKLLGDRLTILRPGNVFGYERQVGRKRFGAYLLSQLVDTGDIHLTVSPFVRRDAVPVDFFCEVLREVVLKRPAGIINVGTGVSVEIGRIALWIIKGFGAGRLIAESTMEADEFQLDTKRLSSSLGLHCDYERIEQFSIDLGRRLRRELN